MTAGKELLDQCRALRALAKNNKQHKDIKNEAKRIALKSRIALMLPDRRYEHCGAAGKDWYYYAAAQHEAEDILKAF